MNKELVVNLDWCKGCGICAVFCPKKVLSVKEKVVIEDMSKCIFCGQCEMRCPDYAIYIKESKENE